MGSFRPAAENELKRVLAYNTLSTQDIYEQVDKPLQKVFATVRTRHQVEDDLERGSIEFVDIEPIEVEVVEQKQPEVSAKRKLLQELLDKKKKNIKGDEK